LEIDYKELGEPNSSPVTNLPYTQALILLGIPEEEREEFIAEHDVESMTKLELQQAVKDRDQAIEEKKDLQKDLNLKSSEIAQLTTQAKSLEKQVKDYKSKYSAEQEKVTLKQRELEAAKEEIPSARKIAELEKKLKTAETKSSAMTADAQFIIHRDNMIKAYDELLKMLTVLDRTDPEMKEKYSEMASKIVENMAKTLKVCKTNLSINTTNSERGLIQRPPGSNPPYGTEEITVVLGDTVEVSEFRHKYDSLQRMSKNLTAAHIKALRQ